MIEDELVKIWQSSSNQERVKFEKSKLMIELQSSLGRLHRWWKYMELFEVALAIFGVLVGVFVIFKVPFVLLKIAIALIVILAIYLIIKYKGVRRFKPSDLEENYLDYLKKNRQYLEVQKKFLKTYLYWGILPVYPIMILANIAVWEKVPIHFIVFNNVAAILVGIYGYFLNKKRVKNEIDPRIVRVDELIRKLQE
ncbi:Hypothetical protein I595_3703 [Croceitalea dokdonensis DOKDO 023]|uniref:Uncharacterized protein n=1 Tax=Croceitalea dokdonensis DOKDO 023 TaxID=1300341 RepID=A0A0P7A1E8_9FLAO|nr:hypothetical protein [Croceitalea dokdonensis]KPM30226.1 Hypothetical protein I595_3703 [Croceitalea dokdonensis DOKDO 023]